MVDIQKHIDFWFKSAEENFKSMLNIYNSKEYMWALFIGHLCIEKYLKAIYVKNIGINVPRTHDLLKIAVRSNLDLTECMKDDLQLITLFNLETRYGDYKQQFFKKCNYEYTNKNISKIKEVRAWLLKQI